MSSSAAIPSGRSRPSGFGMYTLRDGLARYAPLWTRACRSRRFCFEISPVVLPRHAVDPRRGLGLKRPVGRPQAIDVDVVQERGEPRILVLLCHPAHAIQFTWRALPGTGSGARFAGRVPLGGRLPSTASAAPPWALFGGFAGSTGPSDFSRSCITGLRPQPSPRPTERRSATPRTIRTGHHPHPRATAVGWPGGISPPGSRRSRRDSLPSPGSSHQPSVGADQAPVNEEGRLPNQQPRPPAVKALGAPQAPVLLRSPAPQVGADAL